MLGEIVLYRLSEYDVMQLDHAPGRRNPVKPGDEYPAMVVATWSPSVNLRVFLDGVGEGSEYWATSRLEGADPGQWHRRVDD